MKKNFPLDFSFALFCSSSILLILLSFLLMKSYFSQDSFFPPNNLSIPTTAKEVSKVDRAEFEQIISQISAIYSPLVVQHGGNLAILGDWDDSSVNAYAQQLGNNYMVHVLGGLARHPMISNDGLAMVICHELGHHLGEQPKVKSFFFLNSWASAEGQSDYFASLKCMRKYFEQQDNQTWFDQNQIHPLAEEWCGEVFADHQEYLICLRNIHAGINISTLMNSLGTGGPAIDLSTPDPKVVRRTLRSHPPAQCRLDTYAAGALCDKSHTENISKEEESGQGVCNLNDDYKIGTRPLCWYRPLK